MLKEIKKESDVITNQDLFHEIIEKVKESEKWPSNLVDYEQADNYEAGLYDYEFRPIFTLQSGSNEGYYLNLYIRGYYSLTDKFDLVSLGTIKTLFTDKESIRQMAALYGECLIAYEEIMNNELDKFTRKGYDLFLVDALIVVEYTRSKIKESFVRVQLADAKILVSAGMESSTWT